MRVKVLLAVLPALAAGACLAPRYERPALPTPAAFPTGAAYPAPTPDAEPASQIAWRDFVQDDRLRQVIGQALANNRDLRQAAANVAAARAQFIEQRAALFPTISATGTGTMSGGDNLDQTRAYTARAGLSAYEVDLFGRLRNLTRAQQESYFGTVEAGRAAQVSLIGETASAWMTFAADQSLLKLATETRDNAQRAMTLTERRKDAGVASRLDVRSIETVYQQAAADVASYTTAVAQDRNALELLVGAPVDEALLPQGLDEANVLADVPVGVSSAVLLDRPDVLEAEHALKAANADIGAARAALFPSLTLTAQGGTSSAALDSLFKPGTAEWTFVPTVALTLFDAGAKGAAVDYAKAKRDAAVAAYEKTIQTAFRETADALARRGTIADQLKAETGLEAAAADSYTLANARYQAGVDGYLANLESQRSLYSAQKTLISTRLTAYDNLITLYKVLGGGVK
ncbi:efflux transporter outer membrane subunit [Phenylobacterium sp.]|uniref:efflux transporter outer membrane subunit n=1 Tax=Phenylobacterium sp. TaxID=1871053 RepID=UPI0035AF1D42